MASKFKGHRSPTKRRRVISSPSPEPASSDMCLRKKRKMVRDVISEQELSESFSEIGLESGSPSPHSYDFVMDSDPEVSDSEDERIKRMTAKPSQTGPQQPSVVADSSTNGDGSAGQWRYKIDADELLENKNLQIVAETDPADLESDDNDEAIVPVRLLSDFSIYEMETLELVPIADLLQLQYEASNVYGASGNVKAWSHGNDDLENESNITNDDDDDDNDAIDDVAQPQNQRVKLSKILEINIHDFSKQKLDSNIYLRTQHAWYILDAPSTHYLRYFERFWIQHRILHLVASAGLSKSSLYNPRATYDEFVQSLKVTPDSPVAVSLALRILGRELTRDDLEADDIKVYVLSTLTDLRQVGARLSRLPLIRTLLGFDATTTTSEHGVSFEDNSDFEDASPRKKRSNRMPRQKDKPKVNVETDVLTHRHPTVVTPIVGRIANGLFGSALKVAGHSATDDDDDVAGCNHSQAGQTADAHLNDEPQPTWLEETMHPGFYFSVIVNEVTYSVGDIVIIAPGEDDFAARAKNSETARAQCSNSLANNFWFIKICYLFEDDGHKQLHGQWLTPASKTFLQEIAHSKEMCFLDECADVPLSEIMKKANVRMLTPEEDEPIDENPDEENDFFCRLTSIEEDSSLVDLPTESEFLSTVAHCPQNEPCYPCGLRHEKDLLACPRPIPGGGYSQYGVMYHVNDFVLVKPHSSRHGVYRVAQITRIKAMAPFQVHIRLFSRYRHDEDEDACSPLHEVSDVRHLFLTSKTKEVDPEQVDGKCYIKLLTDSFEIDEWVRHDDHFYVNERRDAAGALLPLSSTELRYCSRCLNDRINHICRSKEQVRKHGRLCGLDLFTGAGGLSEGYQLSGFVDPQWAVEFSPSACATLKHNHPNTTVYNQDSNVLLQHAIDSDEGGNPPSLRSIHDGSLLPPMPKRGQVGFISGGPPCQGFSGANHHKKANDVRVTLVCNTLSYVEHYQPLFFQMENVKGMLQFRLKGRQIGRSIVGGIEMGMMKFIYRALIALGYQVSFKVLQAASYGAPQCRERVIIWAAKRGIRLPEFPIPTHYCHNAGRYHNLSTFTKIPPVTRSRNPDVTHQCAPFPAVTVNDAISDLPAFDWINPNKISPLKSTDKDEAQRRSELGIRRFHADGTSKSSVGYVFPGFPQPVPYAFKPLNRYQMWLRQNVTSDAVEYQYTQQFRSPIVERVVNVPLRAGADHTDLPPVMRVDLANRKSEILKTHGIFARINGNGQFKTAMTTVAPNAKGGVLLHPSQKRIVTVRECARAQGFPDHYKFLSVNQEPRKILQDQHRQIGNAVPVPMALALGKSLGNALLEMWEKEETDRAREGSQEA